MKIVDFNNGIKGKIPNDWKSETSDDVVSLYEPDNGVGALQLSFYNIDNAPSIELSKELESYLGDKHEKIIVKIIDGRAYSDIEDEDGIYWQYWLFLKDTTVIFVSYNCDKSDKGIEDPVVKEIISSIGL
ncbi:hypothetical protein OQX63_23185 [Pedobacter sp. PF22-3]|uniref:hypothetical protein n=1 Tax=Pedobacter sp. PF22-3 TaxID=2994467 RepID=UPI002247FB7F|nr:hypothetical protein [Pedobacter sp. PF22-3]MCX2496411.1 hypothetical protein [Pedobacter sp. PF22-3]